MLRLIFIFLLPMVPWCACAQKQASIWYFGHNAGIDFSNGAATPLANGQIYTDEGVASICNDQGALLFYTDGVQVYNAQNSIMPNGKGLLGDVSSSQSAIIVPMITDPNKYYIFTVGVLGTGSFNYSVVNMLLDNGRGDIEVKNVLLQSQVCEKLTAVKHCNGRDIWVIVHAFNSANFLAYLVTPTGISAPVTSNVGTFVTGGGGENAIGCMKASPDGSKIAAAHKRLGVDLLDFDNSTGIVSNAQSLYSPTDTYNTGRGAYGIEFSPNSKLLYVSGDYFNFSTIKEDSYVLQYDATLPDLASIRNSRYIVYDEQQYWYAENFGTLQNAPDGKMYLAEMSQTSISVINNPNASGTACNFVHAQFQTWINGGGMSMYGLPGFVQSYFRPSFTFRGACNGNTLYFDYERSSRERSVKWDFGDPSSGANNFSTTDSVEHSFSSPGSYTVKLIRFTACGSDTVSRQINAGSVDFKLGADTILCDISQFTIDPKASGSNNSYLWQDGSKKSTITAKNSGLYWLQVTDTVSGCSKRDSIMVSFSVIPKFSLGADQNVCSGDVVNLKATIPGDTYLWNDGSTSDTLRVNKSGTYWLQIFKDGCGYKDSVDIIFRSYPVVNLGSDTSLCDGSSLVLHAGNTGMNYQWQNGASNESFKVTNSGIYWVTVSNYNCLLTDTVKINYLKRPIVFLGNDTVVCIDSQLNLMSRINLTSGSDYLWNTGASTSSIKVDQPGIYWLQNKDLNGCIGSDTIVVDFKDCSKGFYVPTAFTPNHDGKNDLFRPILFGNVKKYQFIIYNRWGQVVFQSTQLNKGWDGTIAGILQQSNVFTWLCTYQFEGEDAKSQSGTVMLVR